MYQKAMTFVEPKTWMTKFHTAGPLKQGTCTQCPLCAKRSKCALVLYDALYGTDVTDETNGAEKSNRLCPVVAAKW